MKFKGTITHLSQKGLGVVKNDQNNISYFFYGTWPDDTGEFEVLNKPLNNKKFAYAKLITLTIHPHRDKLPRARMPLWKKMPAPVALG